MGDTDGRVVVVGAGRMGLPIARRLASAGRDVRVVEVAADRREAVRAAGLELIETAARADVLITVLPGAAEVVPALGGASGLLATLPPGAVWIDLTSSSPDAADALAASAAGIASVAAPMRGGPADAETGTLGFYLAGEHHAVDRARLLLADLGRPEDVRIVGDRPAQAHTAKLLANALWFTQAAAVAEVLVIAEAHGVGRDRIAGLLDGSPAASTYISDHLPRFLRGDLMTDFGIDRVVEELDSVMLMARAAGLADGVLDRVTEVHRAALRRYGPVAGELLGAQLIHEHRTDGSHRYR